MTSLPEWVDGPRFAAWIDEVRPDYRVELNPHLSRTVARLREPGTKGRVDTVDRICVGLFLHINEIPDEVWVHEPPSHGRPRREDLVTIALDLLDQGIGPTEISRRLRVHHSTVIRWRETA